MTADKIEICKFDGKAKTIFPLAFSYMRSYNELSKQYKSEEEMELYTYGGFIKKLKKYHNDKSSFISVIKVGGTPKGFVRFSPIPEYYKNRKSDIAKEVEQGEMDGHTFAWERKINFLNDTGLNDKTLCINQIYLDPEIQSRGLGTRLLKETLPEMKKQGYDSIIIEYNKGNLKAKRFYAYILGLKKIAETKDFDHVVKTKRNTDHCLSDVEIGYNTIDNALASVNKIESQRYQNPGKVIQMPRPTTSRA